MKFFLGIILFYCMIYLSKQKLHIPLIKDPYEPKPFVKCFDQIGCMEVNDKWYHPDHRPINLQPLDRNLIRTDFISLKYNTSYEDKLFFDKVLPKKDVLHVAGVKNDADTVILIHDFTSTGYTGWVKHLARILLKKTQNNIISVDWQKGAEPPLDQAIANARVVALETAYLIKVLKDDLKINLDTIHLVGHGLGAHIAAYIGHTHRGIKKITGLDPTGPRFEGMPDVVHLNPDSANYVEVLHTDFFNSRSQGTGEKWGHADFYLNNEELQPGCYEWSNYSRLTDVDRDSVGQGEILPGCSHKRAFKYFIEAVDNNDCTFLGITCSNFQNFEKGLCTACDGKDDVLKCVTFGLMTYHIAPNHSYFLDTFSSPPYCMNTYSISVILGEAGSQTGYFDLILIDEKNNVANASIVDPESETRTYNSNSNNTYLYYASSPKLTTIKLAKVKWTVKSNVLCFILCKRTIQVKEIIVHLLSETQSKEPSLWSRLCPTGKKEIHTDTYATFESCDKPTSSNNTSN